MRSLVGFNRRVLALCAVSLLLQAPTASAELAGVGQLTGQVTPGSCELCGDFDSTGTINFDNLDRDVFGQTVNLSIADVQFTGSGLIEFVQAPSGGAFSASFVSINPGLLSFVADGGFVCPNDDNCNFGVVGSVSGAYVLDASGLMGTMVDAGPGTLPTSVPGVDGIVYTLDGAVTCTTGSWPSFCDGDAVLNVFAVQTTATGSSVQVSSNTVFTDPADGIAQPVGIDVTFDSVSVAGITVITTQSQSLGSIPPNFRTGAVGAEPFFFNVSTNATWIGNVVVCSTYVDSGDIDECANRLMHDDELGTGFQDRTLLASDPDCALTADCALCIDTASNELCARVSSLSPFVVAADFTSDVDAPNLSEFHLSPSGINTTQAPANVRCNITLTDGLAGVDQATCTVTSPSGADSYSCAAAPAPATGNDFDGTWSCLVVIPQGSELGYWQLTEITAVDSNANTMTLNGAVLTASLGGFAPLVWNTVPRNDCSAASLSARDRANGLLLLALFGAVVAWTRRRGVS